MSTPNKLLEQPGHGTFVDTWDVPMNANYGNIDTALGTYTPLNANGLSGTVALTQSDCIPLGFIVTGTPAGNLTYTTPSGQGGLWLVRNRATLGASITLGFASAAGGSTVDIPAATNIAVSADGTANGMVDVDTGTGLPGGSNTQVQVNVGGSLGGYSNFTFDGTTFSAPTTVLANLNVTGIGTGVTQAQAANNTRYATDAYVDRVALQQKLSLITGALVSSTPGTVMSYSDTIPTKTTGDQYMQLAITPKSATSTLKITVVWNGAVDAFTILSMALFQDNTTNALKTVPGPVVSVAGVVVASQIVLVHEMTSGTTSATTFKVRVGPNVAANVYFNGDSSGNRLYGGTMASSITIEEMGI